MMRRAIRFSRRTRSSHNNTPVPWRTVLGDSMTRSIALPNIRSGRRLWLPPLQATIITKYPADTVSFTSKLLIPADFSIDTRRHCG
jgi:hypothetical protein